METYMITRAWQIEVGMLFDNDGLTYQIVGRIKEGDLWVTGERIDPVKGIPPEKALSNKWLNKWWAVQTGVDNPKPFIACLDLEFGPGKYNFRRPQI
ncbi:MAG: hypothetical protein E6Q97_34720 [Desulfurellales bacterium]|nr:MAG: hypothetical protein E6Q97_34720 [Desulfurellales bacterium]